jgi:hypothetical protein
LGYYEHLLPNIIKATEYGARNGETRNAEEILMGSVECKKSFGRYGHKFWDSIKLILKKQCISK